MMPLRLTAVALELCQVTTLMKWQRIGLTSLRL